MDVAENTKRILDEIAECAHSCGRNPEDIQLLAVSKSYSLDHVLPAYEAGCMHFAENKVQEALSKIERAPSGIHWHLIGSLQKNKVRKVIGRFHLIHSVEDPGLAKKISTVSQEQGLVTPVLLQVNTSGESSKHGMSPKEWSEGLADLLKLPGLNIQGFMTIAPLTDDVNRIRACFRNLSSYRDQVQTRHDVQLPHLSMGMSGDFRYAIEAGATLLRIGSALFGSRA